MTNQIVTTKMSASGDSGSLLCDMSNNAVGMLCAESLSVSLYCEISYVQSLLGIRVV